MYVPYVFFHRNKQFKENANKINEFVEKVSKNVENGIGFNMAIEMASYNFDVNENIKKVAILLSAINILKNNKNVSIELKEEIRNAIKNIDESSHNNEYSIQKNNVLLFCIVLIIIIIITLSI